MKGMLFVLVIFYSTIAYTQQPDSTACFSIAKQYADRSDYRKAMMISDSCLIKDSNNTALLNLNGCARIYQSSLNDENNNKVAIKYFSKAIRLEPANAIYYSNRGWSWQMLDKYTEAIKDFRKAVALDSNNVEFAGHVLRILWLQNKNKEAMAYANRIIKKFPDDGYAWYVRGQLKRDYLHQYPEGNKDVKRSEQLGWHEGMHLYY